ncbi:class I SAM-dependent methyltransferase [Acanthopleuribacter pedis]|uniref:Class I SAM-dependent methyltransferase n=1 Tax=Acanthopleuribacter pedis TaxID=442870 RepID=A0A8J7Q2B9_9BACT|nr:class I SAM-dependent methyltransferase [Acanthopleuribacter pedis]MBO1317985.1 class I SAM-dependent methyltransferase [Acanthopleuribacter pedis]
MSELLFAHADTNTPLPRDPAYLADRPCPVCGEQAASPAPQLCLPDFQFFGDHPHLAKRVDLHQVQCRRCFALYMNPCYTPRGFAVLFADAGRSYGATDLRPGEQVAWLQNFGLLKQDHTLLDVGCGAGGFIAAVPPSVRCLGVDIDQASIDAARERVTAPQRRFWVADFEQFTVEERVDVITMFHVLEHLPNPIRVLQNLGNRAQKETRLVVEVPVLEKAKTNDINGYLTPSHLTHFSTASLRQVVEQAGWRIEAEEAQAGYNGYRIIAVPGPVQTEAKGDPNDHGLLLDYLSDWRGQLHQIHQRLQNRLTAHEIILRGGGLHTEMLYQLTTLFHADPQRRYHIVDGDPRKQGQRWRGIPISGPQALAELDRPDRQIVISSYGHQDAMVAEAQALGIPDDRIIRLYDHVRRY